MFPGKMTICDVPKELKGEDFTHHRNHHTMGSAKDHTSQGSRWYAAFASFELWNRHPLMRNYSTEGVLMTQLRNHSIGLCPPCSTAYEMWCAITAKHMWKAPGSDTKGEPWAMFFDELITVDGVTDWASAFHYWLNIITDVDPSEEGLHNNDLRMACKMDALSEDVNKAVPFTTAASGKWKDACRSNTKRAKSIEEHNIVANRRGLFGDQRVKVVSKKRMRDEAAAWPSPELVRSFRSCGHCRLSTEEGRMHLGYCRDCWEEWNSPDDEYWGALELSAQQDREQKQAVADGLLAGKIEAAEAQQAAKEKADKKKPDKENADNKKADTEGAGKKGAGKKGAGKKGAGKKGAGKKGAAKAEAAKKKAPTEKAANEKTTNEKAANEEVSAPPGSSKLTTRPTRRARGSLDSDASAAMFTLGNELLPSSTFDAVCACTGAHVEGNWGRQNGFWDNKGEISAATYDATTKCWAYSIEWKDSNPEDSKWHFGEKVKCIRGI